ncbi:hypothetical protein AB0A71_40035 [Kitasatospora aureofaciens]|uniref:hypothetical protein n=1 Tax=Kitasatospora aureofaciens TaxID=1894 RepID=UPI0033C657C2
MALVGWMVIGALVVAGVMSWRMQRYPGGWRYAFALQYVAERRDLDAARRALRGLRDQAARERETASGSVELAELAHQGRIDAARARLVALKNPGTGLLRDSVGGLWLYEHVLEARADGRAAQYPLHQVSIRDEYSPKVGHVYLALPAGRQQMVSVALDEATSETEVRAFVVKVANAAADAKAAKAERLAKIPQAEAELRKVTADTSGPEQARQRLADLTARQKSDARIPRARRELDAARDRWEKLTGHRPQ